jgi:hypothetical protein
LNKFWYNGAPDDSGYIKIYSNSAAFAAIKADGSIKVWGDSDYGGSGAPYDKDYTEIYSNSFAFVALKADGSITVNLGISITRRRTCASRAGITPRLD